MSRDAIRAGCAEAKECAVIGVGAYVDAIRAGCAEAKWTFFAAKRHNSDAIRAGCAEAKLSNRCVFVALSMQSVRDVLRQR